MISLFLQSNEERTVRERGLTTCGCAFLRSRLQEKETFVSKTISPNVMHTRRRRRCIDSGRKSSLPQPTMGRHACVCACVCVCVNVHACRPKEWKSPLFLEAFRWRCQKIFSFSRSPQNVDQKDARYPHSELARFSSCFPSFLPPVEYAFSSSSVVGL